LRNNFLESYHFIADFQDFQLAPLTIPAQHSTPFPKAPFLKRRKSMMRVYGLWCFK